MFRPLIIAVLISLFMSLALGTVPGRTAEVEQLSVKKQGPRYIIHASTRIDAPPNFVYGIIMDYDNFHRLSSGITTTRFLEPEDGHTLGYTQVDTCVLFFCRKLEKVERITAIPGQQIRANVIPERSDFHLYDSNWIIERDGDGTRLRYDAELDPAFWVPPLIGTWAIRREAKQSSQRVAERIEFLAKSGTPLSEFVIRR